MVGIYRYVAGTLRGEALRDLDIANVAVLQVKALLAAVALVVLGIVACRKAISRYVEVA